jgi:hypothetical protein
LWKHHVNLLLHYLFTWCFHKQNYYMFYRHANQQRTYFILFVTMWRYLLNYVIEIIYVYNIDISNCCVSLLFLSIYFERCGAFVNLTCITKHTVFFNKSVKNSKDTAQQLLISHYICNWVDDVTWLQTKEISQELSMGTKIFKTSYYTVLPAFSFKIWFKRIKILMELPL